GATLRAALFPCAWLFRSVDVALDDVPVQPSAGRQGPLQVDPLARPQLAQRAAAQGLRHHVDGEPVRPRIDHGDTDAVDGDRVARDRKSTRLNSSHVKISY